MSEPQTIEEKILPIGTYEWQIKKYELDKSNDGKWDMKPICKPCQRFFRPKKNGYWFIEGMPVSGSHLPPSGTSTPDQWEPYKLWQGDLWECLGCGAEIVVGTGFEPLAEHYQSDFADKCARYQPQMIQINDC